MYENLNHLTHDVGKVKSQEIMSSLSATPISPNIVVYHGKHTLL